MVHIVISAVQRWSSNATHKRNGRPVVASGVVSFVTNEFPKYFSPLYICDIETGPLLTKL